jgi:actin-related protein
MLMYWPGDVQEYLKECIEKFPKHRETFQKTLKELHAYKWYENEEKNKEMRAKIERKNELFSKFATKVSNVSFEQQKQLAKRLVEADIGEESEYESEADEISTLED